MSLVVHAMDSERSKRFDFDAKRLEFNVLDWLSLPSVKRFTIDTSKPVKFSFSSPNPPQPNPHLEFLSLNGIIFGHGSVLAYLAPNLRRLHLLSRSDMIDGLQPIADKLHELRVEQYSRSHSPNVVQFIACCGNLRSLSLKLCWGEPEEELLLSRDLLHIVRTLNHLETIGIRSYWRILKADIVELLEGYGLDDVGAVIKKMKGEKVMLDSKKPVMKIHCCHIE